MRLTRTLLQAGLFCLLALAACTPQGSPPADNTRKELPSPAAPPAEPLSIPQPSQTDLSPAVPVKQRLAVEPSLLKLAARLQESSPSRALGIFSADDVLQAVKDGSALGLVYQNEDPDPALLVQSKPAALGLAVLIAHPTNPVETLTLGQLKQILSGEVSRWDEIGGADQAITLVLPGAGRPEITSLLTRILAGKKLAPARRVDLQQGKDAVGVVQVNPGALGLLMQSDMDKQGGLKILEIGHAAPTVENAASGAYPLSVRLNWLLPAEPSSAASEMLQFASSQQGQAIFHDLGWAPVSP